ncbi:hypothetical protein IP92_03280 [Pseudoduganella flava]|uniref:Membrane protein insertase YidC n=1 Tax=Pseudoduganella flava TaxID=871742 RepID=A0A562PNS3_9BURK|nr:hypothetical protein [Pseudoduganella flava]QGZ40415.1 hypothetical protein GO485_16045 [Pseudoduganella flava]TWI45850.1 hypothetical protein IP92_03280 [Pseudoduganella flava]
MSTFVTAAQFVPLSVGDALQLLLACAAVVGFVVLFKPMLRGLALAAVLVVKPKLTKEQRLQRRQMRDAAMLKRMMNSQKTSPSEAAELQALASRA